MFPVEKLRHKFSSISNLNDLEIFIKERSAYVTQATLYGYLKTRMGLKYTVMFSDEIFLKSVDKSKWHIFTEAVSDLTLYSFSYLTNKNQLTNSDPLETFNSVIDREKSNGLSDEIANEAKANFKKRLNTFDVINYFEQDPFKNSGQALYHWSPIADELKILDKEVVLNSIKNKWMLVVSDFKKFQKIFVVINFYFAYFQLASQTLGLLK